MLVGQMDGFATTRPSESTASRLLPLPKNSRFLLRNRTKGPTILEGAFLMSIPGQDFRQAARWKSVALYVGFALYFVSFFLPAVDQWKGWDCRSEEHTSELQSRRDLVCR